jgi:hypothetical protein
MLGRTILLVLGFAGFVWSGSASALTRTTSQSAGSVPGVSGTGLAALFYDLGQSLSSLAQSSTLVASASHPTATFTALDVCFPSCGGSANDGGSLASYIALNGTNLSGSGTLGDNVTLYEGYIAIPTAGTYTFSLSSDDGSILEIGGTTIINDDGVHGLSGSSTSVAFQSAGLYSFYVDHFENGGGTGVTVLENGNALATSTLYSSALPVPEPASLALLSAGVLAVGAIRQRKRA